jgi:hypothetical protein
MRVLENHLTKYLRRVLCSLSHSNSQEGCWLELVLDVSLGNKLSSITSWTIIGLSRISTPNNDNTDQTYTAFIADSCKCISEKLPRYVPLAFHPIESSPYLV